MLVPTLFLLNSQSGRIVLIGAVLGLLVGYLAPLAEVAAEAPDYLQWMMGAADMDSEVIEVVRTALGLDEPAKDPAQG